MSIPHIPQQSLPASLPSATLSPSATPPSGKPAFGDSPQGGNARGMGDAARLDARFRRRLGRIVVASVVMGAGLWALNLAFQPGAADSGTLRLLGVLGLCLAGLVLYGVAGLGLKAFTLGELKFSFRRAR